MPIFFIDLDDHPTPDTIETFDMTEIGCLIDYFDGPGLLPSILDCAYWPNVIEVSATDVTDRMLTA